MQNLDEGQWQGKRQEDTKFAEAKGFLRDKAVCLPGGRQSTQIKDRKLVGCRGVDDQDLVGTEVGRPDRSASRVRSETGRVNNRWSGRNNPVRTGCEAGSYKHS